jgi:hypothetical protein
MTYPGSKDRFEFAVIDAIVKRHMDAGDQGRAQAIHTAMRGVNTAEGDIARAAAAIRGRLDQIETSVKEGYRVGSDLHTQPADLAAAIAARQLHYDYLAALLTRTEAIELGIIADDHACPAVTR